MSEVKLQVIARMSARPETLEETKSLLGGLLEPTREENGCIRYDLFQNRDNPLEFTFIEEWTDKNALEAHLASPHIREALVKAKALLASGPEICLYNPVLE